MVERSLRVWEAGFKNIKLVVEASLSNVRHIKGSSTHKLVDRCQNNGTERDIIQLYRRCDILVRQPYKVVIIRTLLQAGTVMI